MGETTGSASWVRYLPPSGALFTVGDASKILGIPRRKIVLFVEQKILSPTVGAQGRGHSRRFSFLDLFKIAVAAELGGVWMPPRNVSACVNMLWLFGEKEEHWKKVDLEAMGRELPEVVVVYPHEDTGMNFEPIPKAADLDISAVPPAAVVLQFRRLLQQFLERVDGFWRSGGA